jgi:hypothetical protein
VRTVRREFYDDRGGVLVWAALALPAVAVLAIGATELVFLNHERARLQDVADHAALEGAREMGAGASSGASDRAKASVLAALGDPPAGTERSVTAEVIQDRLRVRIDSRRPSFFGNMLPPGGFRTAVMAEAASVATIPTCLIARDPDDGEVISVEERAVVNAPRCGVRSNDNLEVQTDARLIGADVQAAGIRKGSGTVTPSVLVGAPVVADPFAAKALTAPAACLTATKQDIKVEHAETLTLSAGVHRGSLEVTDTASVTLAPGEHWFCDGDLTIKREGRLRGDGVALLFAKSVRFKFEDSAHVDLTGAKTGPWAGFLTAAVRDNSENFEIKSVNARRLEGVVYLPAATLKVDTSQPMAPPVEGDVSDAAKWTVAITRELVVKGAPRLYINDDYEGSAVPLPAKLQSNGAHLVR